MIMAYYYLLMDIEVQNFEDVIFDLKDGIPGTGFYPKTGLFPAKQLQ